MTLVKKHPWMLLIPVLWLATWLAARMLNYDAIWVDEFLTYRITGTGTFPAHSVLETLRLSVFDLGWWPPAYFLLFQIQEWLLSSHLFLDRLSALFIGLFGICFTFQLGSKLKNAQTGLYSAALLGLSAFYIFYMHELRGYTLFITMTTLHALVYIVCLDPEQFEKRYVRYGLVVVTALTIYSHYLAAFSILGVGVYHLICERYNPNFSRIIKYSINGLILFVPWIAATIMTVRAEASLDRALPIDTYIFNVLYTLSNSLVPIIALVVLYSLRLLKTKAVRFLWIWGAVNLAAALISNVWLSFLFHPRHIFSLFATLIILMVFGLQHIQERAKVPSLLIVSIWIGLGLSFASSPEYLLDIENHIMRVPRSSMSQMTEIASQCTQPSDHILLAINRNHKAWVHNQQYLDYFFPLNKVSVSHLSLVVTDESEYASQNPDQDPTYITPEERIRRIMASDNNIWLLTLPNLPIQDDVAYLTAELVQRGFSYCEVQDDANLYAGVFTREGVEDCTQICQIGTSN